MHPWCMQARILDGDQYSMECAAFHICYFRYLSTTKARTFDNGHSKQEQQSMIPFLNNFLTLLFVRLVYLWTNNKTDFIRLSHPKK